MTAKKRLNKYNRSTILRWMSRNKPADELHDVSICKKITTLINLINPIVDKKYPTAHMKILEKYGAARKDLCLKFQILDTGRVFGVEFDTWGNSLTSTQVEHSKKLLSLVPRTGGCNTNVIYEGTEEIDEMFQEILKEADKFKEDKDVQYRKYHTFVNQCRTLEELTSVIKLPDEIMEKINHGSTSLVVMNPELVSELKKEFA